MVSRQHMASLVDQRGYIFTLPSLGLPDPAGEWVTIKGAIGVKQQALPLILDETTNIKPSLRSPSAEAKILDFEFQGALWLLPLVTPRGKVNDPPEIFSVRVQRLLPSSAPDSTRVKLPDDHKWICLTPPEGMTAYLASLAPPATSTAVKPQAARFSPSSTKGAASATSTSASPRPTARHRSTVIECSEVDGNHNGEWRALALKTLDKDWVGSIFYQNLADLAQQGLPTDSEGLTIVLREHPAFNNEIRSLDYAIVRVGEHDDDDFEEERWKTLPPQAFKPGAERKLVNSARRSMGKRPLTEDEWASRPAAALRVAGQATAGQGVLRRRALKAGRSIVSPLLMYHLLHLPPSQHQLALALVCPGLQWAFTHFPHPAALLCVIRPTFTATSLAFKLSPHASSVR